MKVFCMNMKKNWLLAFFILSAGEMSYSGPLAKTVYTSVGVSTYMFATGLMGRAFGQLFGAPTVPLQDIVLSAGAMGVVAGAMSAPIFSSLHGADLKIETENRKDRYSRLHHQEGILAWKDIIDRRKSLFEKNEARKKLIASQLALHTIAEYNTALPTTRVQNVLDCTPIILTVCGLFPVVLCSGSFETMGTILAASYCSGGVALLHAKMQEKKWNAIEKQVHDLYRYKLEDRKAAVDLPDNFIRALDLKIDKAQRRADEECSQMNLGMRKDAMFALIKEAMDQPLQLDEAALSQADRESRITQRFDVRLERNENNTERAMTIFQR